MNNNEIIQSLKSKRMDLEKQIEAIDITLSLFVDQQDSVSPVSLDETPVPSETSIHPDGYDSNWSWKNKIIHVLKIHNRFLHIKEIAESIAKYENSKKPLDEIITSFRQSLSALKADQIIVRVSVNNQLRFSFWGSPGWLDKNGQIKEGYEYDPSFFAHESMLTI